MNTGIRRFILRLIVGVLTFAAGVGAAILLGGFSPFRSYSPRNYSPTSYERQKGCEYRRNSRSSMSEAPGGYPEAILLKGPRGIRIGKEIRAVESIPSDSTAPVPPNPPLERR